MRRAGSEANLYEQIAQYLNLKHPNVLYHFDLSGVNNPSKYTRSLYDRLNRRAWPDLYIAKPTLAEHGYITPGLFIELKREGTRLKKKNGEWVSEHIAEQAAILDALSDVGYYATFAVGFDEAVFYIEAYLGQGGVF